MDKGVHFISGLPRSGSTLLSALLRQNPDLHAGMSGPAGAIVSRLQGALGPKSEYASMITDTHRRDIMRAAFEAYYRNTHSTKTVIDTNRAWCAKLPLVADLFPDAKIIVCVRDLVWIMDSFERVLRKNALIQSKMFKPQDNMTVYTRVSALASPGGTVGFAWNATQEAFYGEHAHRLIVIDYEALAREPKRVMDLIYDKLELPHFAHDFDNVVYGEGDEFDANLGVPGLHTVGRKVGFHERQTILPPELFERFSGRNFWRRPGANPRAVTVVLPQAKDGPRRLPSSGVGMMGGGRMRPPAGA